MIDPFEFLRRDLEKISRALGPNLLPTTFQKAGRVFVFGYTSLIESPPAPGTYVVNAELVEVGRGGVGGLNLVVTPEKRLAIIDFVNVIDRRLGLGTEMVRAVEKDLASRGYRRIELLAVKDSIPFWRSLGYRPVGEPTPEGGQSMVKRL